MIAYAKEATLRLAYPLKLFYGLTVSKNVP